MLKFSFHNLKKFNIKMFSTKSKLRTEVRELKNNLSESAVQTLTRAYDPNFEKQLTKHLSVLLWAIPSAMGMFFIYKIMWSDYLTARKKEGLKNSMHIVMGMGTLLAGTLLGNCVHDLKKDRLNKPNMGILFKSNRHLIYVTLFLALVANYELMERNITPGVVSITTGLGYHIVNFPDSQLPILSCLWG
jgi:hypothetical protein